MYAHERSYKIAQEHASGWQEYMHSARKAHQDKGCGHVSVRKQIKGHALNKNGQQKE